MQDKRLTQNMIGSALCRPLSVLIGLAYYPVVLHYLGDYRYGIWATLISIMSWITYFDIGLGNGLRNHLVRALGDKSDPKRARELVSSAYFLLSVIVFAVIAGMLVLGRCLNVNAWLGAADYAYDLYGVFAICVVTLGINFIFTLNQSIYYALQRARVVPFMGVTQQALILVGTVSLQKFVQPNLLPLAAVYGGASLLNSAIYAGALFVRHPELRPSPRCYSHTAAKNTVSLVLQFFVIQMAGLVLFSTDNLIITNLYAPTAVTVYSTVNKVFMLLITSCNALMAPLWSAFTQAGNQNEWGWVRGKIRLFWWCVLPIAAAAGGLAVFCRPLIQIWMRVTMDIPNTLLLCMAVYAVVYIISGFYGVVTNGLGLMKLGVWVAVFQGVSNIPFSIFFAKTLSMGVSGVALGTVVSLLLPLLVTPWLVRKYIAQRRAAQSSGLPGGG